MNKKSIFYYKEIKPENGCSHGKRIKTQRRRQK